MRQIRIHNLSTRDFTNVSISGQAYGEIASGETTEYRSVGLRFRHATLELRVDGKFVTGQTLNFGAKRFTYRIAVVDLDARRLAIDVIRDDSAARRPNGEGR